MNVKEGDWTLEENSINLTENDIRVMGYIFNKETGIGLSKAKGITIDEIKVRTDEVSNLKDITTISISKIRNAINKLIECGYVDLAVKRGLKKSYHITTEGFNYIIEIKKSVIRIEN